MHPERCESEGNRVNPPLPLSSSSLFPSLLPHPTPHPPTLPIHTPSRSHRSNPSMDSLQIRSIHSSEHPLTTPTFLSTFPLQLLEIPGTLSPISSHPTRLPNFRIRIDQAGEGRRACMRGVQGRARRGGRTRRRAHAAPSSHLHTRAPGDRSAFASITPWPSVSTR